MIEVAISSWSLHSLFLNPDLTGLSGKDFPRLAREYFGVRHIEYFEGDYGLPDRPEYGDEQRHVDSVRQACEAEGVRVICLASIDDLTHDDEMERARARSHVANIAWHAAKLSCPIVRVNSGRHRLDDQRARVLRAELIRLVTEIGHLPVKLAVENHPHTLRCEREIDRLWYAVDGIDHAKVGLCPDVGAFGNGLWETAIERFGERILHVHAKPAVRSASGGGQPLSEYAPRLRELLGGFGYRGAISYEHLPSRDLLARDFDSPFLEARDDLRRLAEIFGVPTEQAAERPASFRKQEAGRLKVIRMRALAPSPQLVDLLADGCADRLGSKVAIHDFPSGKESSSRGRSGHPAVSSDGVRDGLPVLRDQGRESHFCELVGRDPGAAKECQRFYTRKLGAFRDGAEGQPRVCICPMGLMILSVPIRDGDRSYGVITTGPWVEQGTEGMAVDSVETYAGRSCQDALQAAWTRVDSYSQAGISQALKLLVSLANNLGVAYREREVNLRYLRRGPTLMKRVQGTMVGATLEFEDLLASLEPILVHFEGVVEVGSLGLYQYREDEPPGFHLLLPRSGLPSFVPASRAEAPATSLEKLLEKSLRGMSPTVWVSGRESSDIFVVFLRQDDSLQLTDRGSAVTRLTKQLFVQFASEIHYAMAVYRNLSESNQRTIQMSMFIDRFKHAISSPLQGLDDRIQMLRTLIERDGSDSGIPHPLSQIQLDMRDFSNEAGALIERLTGRVRLMEGAELRLEYDFQWVNAVQLLHDLERKFKRVAQRRGNVLRLPPEEHEVRIFADAKNITELFSNLIENAIKFADDGATVGVGILGSDAANKPPWTVRWPGYRFSITDIGLGVRPEEYRHVFKPYVQGKARRTDRIVGGTGLGLAICQSIVDAHWGKIEIISKPLAGREALPEAERYSSRCVVEVLVDLPRGPVIAGEK